ncbi:M48 family metalloprotease [Opitutus sp. GAS368]|uniref:M48 family metalloprotease n=1 Tax=Opitutus sp. GAS368 TaxID=1882749 RepID=UPI00087BB4E5|nr:M48 family metalloprotease [Opitutus sp. GAS368]SDS33314.1 Zn-dependent protease with chaperone function [Opitutus sp. GAS368]
MSALIFPEVFVTCAFVAWALNELELIGWRRSQAMHWTERARRLFPARVSRQINVWVIPACAALLHRNFNPASPSGLVFLCGFLGTLLGNYPMDRDTHYDLAFRPWAHEVVAGLLMQFSTLGAYLAASALMPARWDWRVPVITVVFLGLLLALQFGLAVRLMRALRLLRPASPRLQQLVDETAATLGVKVRATWELARCDANAIAFVLTGELAFTDGLLVYCPDDELKAICAHEVGHLTEGRLSLTARLLGSLIFAPLIFLNPVYHQWGLFGVAGLVLVVLVVLFARPRLSRAMEKRADRIAQESVAGTTVYARALERLYRVNCSPAALKKGAGRTHPDLYDRMLAVGLTPDYPRPAPPRPAAKAGRAWFSPRFASSPRCS